MKKPKRLYKAVLMEENNINEINGEEQACAPAPVKKKNGLQSVYDMVEVIVVSLAIVIFVLTFVGRMTTVDGDSMYPTLENTEKLWVMSLGYKPENGDIVVVQEKDGQLNYPLVKRIIAMGGQTVTFDFDEWKVYVDGELLCEDYINYEDWCNMKSYGCPESVEVPQGYIFVMGDNRNHSTDSRDSRVGFISEDDIIGKVALRIFPLDKFGAVN